MSMKKSEKLDVRSVNTRSEFFQTMKEKGLILAFILLYIIAWIVIVIFYTIDLNTFLMIILSWLLPIMLSYVWIRAEARLSMALNVVERLTKEKEDTEE